MDYVLIEKILKKFLGESNINTKYIYLFSLFNDEYVIDERTAIVGLKKEGEKLRFYINKSGQIKFPFISALYDINDIDKNIIFKSVIDTNLFCESNPDVVKLKNNTKKPQYNKNDYLKRVKNYYNNLSMKIAEIIDKQSSLVLVDDIYNQFKNKRKKTIFNALKYGNAVLLFSNYVESLNNIIFIEDEKQLLYDELVKKINRDNIIPAKQLFSYFKYIGLMTRNGIDDYKKFYEFIFKLFMNDFKFISKGKFIAKIDFQETKIICENLLEEFSIDKELEKIIELEDLDDEF